MWPPISRDDLKVAATRSGFDMVLPVLIRRLISETSNGLVDLDMPGESGVAAGGFDGVARATAPSPFVPDGVSVWELSVGGNDAKADDDYQKRIEGPPGHQATDCTYIQLILAPWTKARAWASGSARRGRWREVRAYNLDRVHLWLESAPATSAWLAAQLGKAMPGVRSVEDWWLDTWLASTLPQLHDGVVLAGRKASAALLIKELSSGRTVVSLGGNLRLEEAAAFVAAALHESQSPQAQPQLSRALIVSDRSSAQQLIAQPSSMILLLSDSSLARDLPTTHPHQLLILAPPGDKSAIDVERLDQAVVASLLGSDRQAGELGQLARRSLLALRRRLAINPSVLTPAWALHPDAAIRRFLLLGSWRGGSEADRSIVESTVGYSYSNAISKAELLRRGSDDPFLESIKDEWFVVARDDAWNLLSPAIDIDDVRAFQSAAVEVLSELDPVLDLDPDEQWKAGMRDVHRIHSSSLRRGLAESVALMGGSDQMVASSSTTMSEFSRSLVRGILDGANGDESYRQWASLSDVIELLAEGAPTEFLAAMRAGLSGSAPLHAKMFRDARNANDMFGPSSPHTAFLWALETLAWSPEIIDDVVRVLIGLDAIDPGGRLSNRPRASLLGILSVWSPQTSALLDDRLRCIRVVASHGTNGFEILLDLIPDSHPIQMSHSSPDFRGWRTDQTLTYDEVFRGIREIETLLLEFRLTPHRARALITKLNRFGSDFRDSFANRATIAAGDWSPEERASVFEALRDFLAQHLEYADAKWALPTERLAALMQLRDLLEPTDTLLRHRWLFRQAWVSTGDFRRRDDYAAHELEISRRRRFAAEELYAEHGLDGILALAEAADPWIVGRAIGATDLEIDAEMIGFAVTEGVPGSVAAGFMSVRLASPKTDISALLEQSAEPAKQAFLLRYLADQRRAIDLLDGLDPEVAMLYWRSFHIYGLGHDFRDATEAGWRLVDAGRPVAAINLGLLHAGERPTNAELAELFALSLESLLARNEPDPELQSIDSYDLERVFEVLAEHRDKVGHHRVVVLEWQLLPLSSLDGHAPSLHTELASNPAFFVELITACFRPASDAAHAPDEPEREQIESQKRANASRAYEVLHSWATVPGVDSAGDLDSAQLQAWIEVARRELESADRAEIGDLQIGEMLSHAPTLPDGAPLPEQLRSLLEQLASEPIMRGIAIGLFNSRGIVSRDLLEGGALEWELARHFRKFADGARPWPLTRALFTELAEGYESDARREDITAERRRQGRGLR